MTLILRRWLARGLILFAPAALAACSTTAPMPKVVKVAIPVPCEIAQVPPAVRPKATPEMGLYDLVKVVLADLRILEAENAQLRAANTANCTPKENVNE